jgi:Flp pilus assembly protein TadG
MRIEARTSARRGAILPYLAISLVALIGFIALAIDLGVVMIAKTQAQNAADAAAFAAARTLTGGASSNTSQATANGQAVAAANTVVGTSIPTANVTIANGAYHYDSGSQSFYPQFPPVAPDSYNLSQATITQSNPTFFAQVFGISTYNVTATAIAAHRPRDTTIVLDFSGSMNNESDLWNCEPYEGSYQGTSNNADPVFPQWGYYNTTFSPQCLLQCTSTSDLTGYCNISQAVGGCGPQTNDYYQNARGASAIQAFTAAATWAAITAPANVNAGFSSSLTLPKVTLSNTQPAGDQAQSTYRSPSGKTYGAIIASAKSGRTAGNTILAVNDLIPTGYGSGTSVSPYNGINLWGSAPFGYTVGPNYWGMTFFQWPPDPNNDWRQLYFLSSNGTCWYNSQATNTTQTSTSSSSYPSAYPSNSALFSSSGSLNTPTSNYQINYKAILAWINANCVQQTTGDGRPFPPMLRAANTTLYSYVPTDVPASAYTWSSGNQSISWPDSSTRFWKEYIDFVIGVYIDPTGNIQVPGTSTCSYGPDYTAGSSTSGQYVSISGTDSTVYINGLVNFHPVVSNGGSGYTSAPTVTFSSPQTSGGTTAVATATVAGGRVTGVTLTNPGSGYTTAPTITFSGGGGTNAAATATLQTYTFMNPSDNPLRPRHRFWFSPMTMIQYMMDTGVLPGITSDVSMLPAKLGIQGALTDIQNNHPNDLVAMLMFSRPHYNGEPTAVGQFTYPVNSLSNNYSGMINSLWFPPNSGTSDVTPWTADGLNTPHAHADYDSNTCTSYGLMLAYNQFSSSSVLSSGSQGGGLGRKGAQRLLILETDGMANQASTVSFVNSVTGGSNPTNNSYYNIGGNNASASGSSASQDAINVATKICALTTDTTNGPGFATATKPVTLHCIAFGALFMPDADGTAGGNAAMSLLQSLSAIGGTGFPSSVTDTTSPYYYKLCIGTLAQRQSSLQTAFTTIMDDGIAIIMVK